MLYVKLLILNNKGYSKGYIAIIVKNNANGGIKWKVRLKKKVSNGLKLL